MSKSVTPYGREGASKKVQVTEMFDNIAPRYDLLNHLLTLGIDIHWRKKAVRLLTQYQAALVVDIATGTADFALAVRRSRILGVEITEDLLHDHLFEQAKKRDKAPGPIGFIH